jgi:outer membrane protein assembly factor BamB
MRLAAMGVVILGITAAAVVGQGVPVRSRPELPSDASLQALGLRRHWVAAVPVESARDRIQLAQVLDDQLIFQNASGMVSAVQAETGVRQWTVSLGRPYRDQHLGAAANKFTLCILSGMKLYGIDRPTGIVAWSMDTPGIPSAPLGLDELRCYLATTDGEVYAYVIPLSGRAFQDRFGGEEKGKGDYQSLDPITNPTSIRTPFRLWDFQTNSEVVQAPVPLATHVVFANKAGVLYSFQRDVNRLGDRFYSRGPITAPISSIGNDIYVASQDYAVYNFEMVSGRFGLRWQTTIHSRILDKPIIVGPELYVVGLDQGLFCLDRGDGSVRWRQPEAAKYLAASKRLVLAADRFGNTLCLDRANGRLLQTWNTRGWGHRLTNEYTDRLYLASDDGTVVCLRDLDPQYARPYHHNAPPPRTAPTPRQPAGEDAAAGMP